MVKEVKKTELKDLVDKGYKLDDLAELYGVPKTRMSKVLKAAGLRIKSTRGNTLLLVDDCDDESQIPVVDNAQLEIPYREENSTY